MDAEQNGKVEHISARLPQFSSNTRIWLLQVEAHFLGRRITSQLTRFYYLVEALPTPVAEQLVDLIDPVPEVNPYDTLKSALLERTTASDELRLQQLLSGVELGDRTPSQLLRHMRALVGNLRVDDSILKQLWVKRLSKQANAILSTSDPQSKLEDLARTADKIHECFTPPVVSEVQVPAVSSDTTSRLERLEQHMANLAASINKLSVSAERGRSRNRAFSQQRSPSRHASSQRICRYHRKFGHSAKHCRTPCDFAANNKPQYPGNDQASQ